MLASHTSSWKNLWLSSSVLSISLLGDALLYVVLPVNAYLFGVSMVWVGVLLAVNRIIRTFTYGLIVQLAETIGLKNLCLVSAVMAIASTAGYGLLSGPTALIISRVIWGLSYAGLLLVTLAYAVEGSSKTATRVGLSRAVEQVGPLLALTAGTWLASVVGAKDVFLYLAGISLFCIPFALALKSPLQMVKTPKKRTKYNLLLSPNSFDFSIFLMGLGIDGLFTITISLMWLDFVTPQTAIMLGGFFLAGRRLVEMVTAPLAGIISDSFGVKMPLIFALILVILGFFLVGMGSLIIGSILIILARGALGTLYPAAVSLLSTHSKLEPLARNQAWRDVGAALGPLGTGFLLIVISPMALHTVLSGLFIVSFIWLLLSPSWKDLQNGS